MAAGQSEGLPLVVICGPANAGKSSLFNALAQAPALVSDQAGTTRDCLEEVVLLEGRRLRLVDTPGWMEPLDELDRAALDAGARLVASADLVLACSAPDAVLPQTLPGPADRILVVATKRDAGPADPRASVAVSVRGEPGLQALRSKLALHLSATAVGEPRQQRLLSGALQLLQRLLAGLPADELLAEDLRQLDRLLGDLVGAGTSDEVLDRIFSRFCIGK